MKYYHSIFKHLHFDYGKMLWSVNHIPFFGTLLSSCDHRGIGSMHSITFYAFLRVLTNRKIKRDQSDAIFALIDMSAAGEISFSEIAFFLGILVAQKDHLEREFIFMHAWKIWVTFNEDGSERITTKDFRKTGLFFDFDYPTIYHMFREYNWDDDNHMEFERFRFYLLSCIHFRTLRRATAKFTRYKKFKVELLDALHLPLVKVLRDNIYPAPTTVLRAIKAVKLPPIEGQDKIAHWSDAFTFQWLRNFVHRNVSFLKLEILDLMDESCTFRWFTKGCCCGLFCFGKETRDMEKVRTELVRYTAVAWNFVCCVCSCLACLGLCFVRKEKTKLHETPLKPVVHLSEREKKRIRRYEKKPDKFKQRHVEFKTKQDEWNKKKVCSIQ